jgi:hypothetical protein
VSRWSPQLPRPPWWPCIRMAVRWRWQPMP